MNNKKVVFVIIAPNCVILPGVTIGEGAAIGALSLIKEDVEPWTVVAGIPARKISDRPRTKSIDSYYELMERVEE